MAITPTDFEKIWSSNASTPAYTFSEADYLEGWDFVGNLPPTRAQWNAIQKRTDEKMKYVFDNFGAPLIAPTVADMTLQNRVYVYTGSEVGYTAGDWYYYDAGTSTWVDGGVYNAVAIVTDTTLTQAGVPADAKATGDAIALKPNVDPTLTISGAAADAQETGMRVLDDVYMARYMLTADDYLTIDNKYLAYDGSLGDSNNYCVSDYILLNAGETVSFRLKTYSTSQPVIVVYNIDKTLYGRPAYGHSDGTPTEGTWTAPRNYYIRICTHKKYKGESYVTIGDSGKLLGIKRIINDITKEAIGKVTYKTLIAGVITAEKISTTSSTGKVAFYPVTAGKRYALYRKVTDNNYLTVGQSAGDAINSSVTNFKAIISNGGYHFAQEIDVNPYIFTAANSYPYFAVCFKSDDPNYTEDELLASFDVYDLDVRYEIAENSTVINNITNPMASIFADEVKTTINTAKEKMTSPAIVVGVITDTHINNVKAPYYLRATQNMKTVCETLSFDITAHLGDLIDGGTTKAEEIENISFGIKNLLNVGGKRIVAVVGNHDNNGLNPSALFTEQELYGQMQQFSQTVVVRDGITSNYYVDYPNLKIRIIFVDSCYQAKGFTTDTIDWVSTIMANAPSDYGFVFFTHEPTRGSLISTTSGEVVNGAAFEAVLAQYGTRVYGYFHGHTHFDNVSYINGYPEVSITCGQPYAYPTTYIPQGATVPSRTIGDVTQDAWDVVVILPNENKFELIRFGAGNDRTIPFRE